MYTSIIELTTNIDWEKIFFQIFDENCACLVLHEGYEIFVYVVKDKIYGYLTPMNPFDIFVSRNNGKWVYCGENVKMCVYAYIQEFIDRIDDSLREEDISSDLDF